MITLGIDTSCDDTSVALLNGDNKILSNIVSSQVDLHRFFGGVVPEIASRKHVELIDTIYANALEEAGISSQDIDLISVTNGPGLIGSILVGLCFAKGLVCALKKPLVAVNHVEAHAMSIFLENKMDFPFIALVVSGGHTIILLFKDFCDFVVLGTTRDDAAGEAFDKIAKFLNIGYPGGKVIEDMASGGIGDYVLFPRPMKDDPNYDFSFSGLKTSFINYINKNGFSDENLMHILSSFQEAVCDLLSFKVMKAAQRYGIKRIVVGGGVAANKRLREVFSEKAATSNLDVRFSSTQFCTDNGAMIAVTGYNYYKKGIVSSLDIRGYSRMAMS
ncbi:MAG TPA: tRNA (adenosine(37)-N6)-threonylcarbamoyltransferase complex transferase subunit TsaD [Syntrophorhabdaceae bacterium]|nr:tRNA (adenosine(37)-N6)-threonylcarbamoyltransferase complex transferase subunit TsaD [Syntrophorhabdaceae bacterium]